MTTLITIYVLLCTVIAPEVLVLLEEPAAGSGPHTPGAVTVTV